MWFNKNYLKKRVVNSVCNMCEGFMCVTVTKKKICLKMPKCKSYPTVVKNYPTSGKNYPTAGKYFPTSGKLTVGRLNRPNARHD